MRHTITLTAAAAALSGTAAFAQTSCGPRVEMTERLMGTYGEAFSGGGLQDGQAVFEVWTSEKDGTWTILMTRADGTSCVMAAGTDWQKALASQAVTGKRS